MMLMRTIKSVVPVGCDIDDHVSTFLFVAQVDVNPDWPNRERKYMAAVFDSTSAVTFIVIFPSL